MPINADSYSLHLDQIVKLAVILVKPAIAKRAKEELLLNVGEDFEYFPLLGDRNPLLDYRKN